MLALSVIKTCFPDKLEILLSEPALQTQAMKYLTLKQLMLHKYKSFNYIPHKDSDVVAGCCVM